MLMLPLYGESRLITAQDRQPQNTNKPCRGDRRSVSKGCVGGQCPRALRDLWRKNISVPAVSVYATLSKCK